LRASCGAAAARATTIRSALAGCSNNRPFQPTTPHAFPGYQKEPTHAHDLNLLARISDLVAQGINIAGIAQILHLQHRNTELESDNSDLKSENARLRSDKPTKGRRTGNR